MKCETVKEYLPFYYHNDLDKTKMSEIKTHIKNCTNCKREFNCLKKTLKLVEKEEKIGLNFIQKRILLNRILKSAGLQKERIFLQRKRAFAFGSSFAATALLLFFLLLNIKTSDMKLNWQNNYFTYKTEQLEESIADIHKIIAGETIQSAEGYSIDVEINSIYEDIEEITAFLSI